MDASGWIDFPLLIILLLLGFTLYLYGSYPMGTWTRLGVPGPSSLPFVGNIHEFFNSKTGVRASVSEWQKQHGKIVGIHYFRKPCLVVTDVEALKNVFVKEYNIYHDRFFVADGLFFPELLCKGVFFRKGSDWKRIRRIMTTTFTSGTLKTLTHHINTTARHLADKFVEHAEMGTAPRAKYIFGAFSLDVIAGTTFSLEVNSQKDMSPRFSTMVRSLFKPTILTKLALALAGVFPFLGYVFNKMNVSIFDPKAVQYINEYLGELVSERKNGTEAFKRRDAIQYLIDTEMDDASDIVGEKSLTKEEIISQGITFLIAGYDTTSSALQFTAHLLAKHKDVQEKLLQEIDNVIGDCDEITYNHCQRLTFMECVFNESLRLYPPVHLLKRETNKHTTLSGFSIPPKTGIFIPVYNIGRDPELFVDPDSFNPSRFTDEISASSISFLPFGFGPKQCIGMRLAMMALKIALVHVLRKVQFESAYPEVLEFDDFAGILCPKEPVTLTLKLRGE